MMIGRILLTIAVAGTLAACSLPFPRQGAPAPETTLSSPPASATPAPATARPPAAVAPVPSAVPAEPGGRREIPEAAGWTNPDVPLSKKQADVETCYRYAQGQVGHDQRVDSDIDAGRVYPDDNFDFTRLRQGVDRFDYGRRRGTLFDSCMTAKGYVRR